MWKQISDFWLAISSRSASLPIMFDKTLRNKSGQRNNEHHFLLPNYSASQNSWMIESHWSISPQMIPERPRGGARYSQTWLEDKESESSQYMNTNEIAARVGVGATHGCTA
jgi:hypothetical protein